MDSSKSKNIGPQLAFFLFLMIGFVLGVSNASDTTGTKVAKGNNTSNTALDSCKKYSADSPEHNKCVSMSMLSNRKSSWSVGEGDKHITCYFCWPPIPEADPNYLKKVNQCNQAKYFKKNQNLTCYWNSNTTKEKGICVTAVTKVVNLVVLRSCAPSKKAVDGLLSYLGVGKQTVNIHTCNKDYCNTHYNNGSGQIVSNVGVLIMIIGLLLFNGYSLLWVGIGFDWQLKRKWQFWSDQGISS